MSSIIKYNRFFSVRFNKGIPTEDASENDVAKILEGVTFFPTHRCLKNLRNYNLVFRPRPGGFDVFYSQIPLVEITSQLQFTFGFTYSGGHLLEKLGLPDTDTSGPIYPGLYFNNVDEHDGEIIARGRDSLASNGSEVNVSDSYQVNRLTFNVFDDIAAIPLNYSLVHQIDKSLKRTFSVQQNSLADYIITTINPQKPADNYIGKPGPYLLKADTGLLPDRRLYLDEELGQKPVKGVVDIYWKTSQQNVPDTSGQIYDITFKT